MPNLFRHYCYVLCGRYENATVCVRGCVCVYFFIVCSCFHVFLYVFASCRDLAPASKTNRSFTEAAREYLTLRGEEARCIVSLDRTMMFEAQSVFRARTQRVVAHTVRNAMR